MSGSVKNKIRAGTIFLFLLVLLSGGFSIYYLVRLQSQSKNILKANYESLQFAMQMQVALDSIEKGKTNFVDSFNLQLKKQETNITELGEPEVTRRLRQDFGRLNGNNDSIIDNVRFGLQEILRLNMAAINRKSEKAGAAIREAKTYLITIVSVIFLVSFTFVVNFPGIITEPIRRLTEAIQEIARKNYKHRIHIESKDEFGELANAFNEMAERLEYFESSNLNKLIFEKIRAEAVINSLKDASIGIDKNNTVLFANNQALQLLGLEAKDIVGKHVDNISSRNDLFRHLLEEKGNMPFKIVVDSRENYYTKEIVDVVQDDTNSKVIVLKNITTFKELDVAKTNFIATVSHELKTPLASSDFSLKLLEDERVGNLSKEQKELIQNLKQDNQRMLRILSELLNMTQAEAGKIKLHVQMIQPDAIVEGSIQAVTTWAKEKKVKIIKTLEKDLPICYADGDKITWVLNNFLTNAIKYSPVDSKIFVAVKAADGMLAFSVKDNGPGIEEKYLNRIFERYFQVPGRSDVNSSGIGLAICKEFVEAMSGTVWVKSIFGEGSTFGFEIPIIKSA